jgi:hypothetical protein
VLQALREKIRTKQIWITGANHYRNPEADLPADFDDRRAFYYRALGLPENVEAFIEQLQHAMCKFLNYLGDFLRFIWAEQRSIST